MHGAIAENRSVRLVHEDSSTELPTVGTTRPRGNRGKSAFLEMLIFVPTNNYPVILNLARLSF